MPTLTALSQPPARTAAPRARKSPFWNKNRSALRLASALLLVTPQMIACLGPQDDTELPPDPIYRNRRPYLVENLIKPTVYVETGTTTTCFVDLSITVADPDVDDPIYVRWFVDYDSDAETVHEKEQSIASDGNEVRASAATYRVNPGAVTGPFTDPGRHLVEAVVADGTIIGRLPEADDKYSVTHSWIVNIDPTITCP
jgi:hypothetical protein